MPVFLVKGEVKKDVRKGSRGKEVDYGSQPYSALKERPTFNNVRNYQARNNLRRMTAGTTILYYHSGVPAKEGVAGIAGITKAKGDAYADPEQYDPESPCYEPKGDQADGPRWYCVDLEPVREFSPFIPFNVIRAAAEMDLPFISKEDKKALSDWSLLKQGRLSVHEVSDAQYKAILNIEKALAEGKEFPVAAGNLFGPKGKAAAAAAPEGDEKKKKTTTGKKKGKAATDEEDGEDDGAVEAGAGAGASKQLSGKKRKRATAE